jgi:hypothetical protein
LAMDSTQVDVYGEIAKSFFAAKKYKEAGDAYQIYADKSPNAKLQDRFYVGFSYYFAFTTSAAKPGVKPDSSLLVKADSAFSYVGQKSTTPIAQVYLFRARIAYLKEMNLAVIPGLAKPYYEKFIETTLAKGVPTDDRGKAPLIEAYNYLGAYYELKEKDDAKAAENFGKSRDLDPTNKQAADYFKRKGGAKSK